MLYIEGLLFVQCCSCNKRCFPSKPSYVIMAALLFGSVLMRASAYSGTDLLIRSTSPCGVKEISSTLQRHKCRRSLTSSCAEPSCPVYQSYFDA